MDEKMWSSFLSSVGAVLPILVDGIPKLGPQKAHLDEPLLPAEAPWNVFMSKAMGVRMVKSRANEICKVYGRNEAVAC